MRKSKNAVTARTLGLSREEQAVVRTTNSTYLFVPDGRRAFTVHSFRGVWAGCTVQVNTGNRWAVTTNEKETWHLSPVREVTVEPRG